MRRHKDLILLQEIDAILRRIISIPRREQIPDDLNEINMKAENIKPPLLPKKKRKFQAIKEDLIFYSKKVDKVHDDMSKEEIQDLLVMGEGKALDLREKIRVIIDEEKK